jgi:amino acid transporter
MDNYAEHYIALPNHQKEQKTNNEKIENQQLGLWKDNNIIGCVVFATIGSGILALLFAICAFLVGEWLASGIGLLATGITFGMLVNAYLHYEKKYEDKNRVPSIYKYRRRSIGRRRYPGGR